MTPPPRKPEHDDRPVVPEGPYIGAWAAAAVLLLAVAMASGALG